MLLDLRLTSNKRNNCATAVIRKAPAAPRAIIELLGLYNVMLFIARFGVWAIQHE
jgi:hypothetical protein